MQSSFLNKPHLSPSAITDIELSNCGKRFNRDWIFRDINYTFKAGRSYAITGPNGSGKSTLLQTIAGAIAPSKGSVVYRTLNEKSVEVENAFNHIAIVAPYLEVIEEMTAVEFLQFHGSFKALLSTIAITEILNIIGLGATGNKQIRFYSSGMKQRIKLAQAVFSNVPVLLLDEPCTNFDTNGYQLYHHLIKEFCTDKLIIVSSNDNNEYDFCEERLSIIDFK